MDTHTDQDGHGRIEKFFFLLGSNVPDEGYQNYIRWKLCRGYLTQKNCYISERVFGSFSLHFLSESQHFWNAPQSAPGAQYRAPCLFCVTNTPITTWNYPLRVTSSNSQALFRCPPQSGEHPTIFVLQPFRSPLNTPVASKILSRPNISEVSNGSREPVFCDWGTAMRFLGGFRVC